MALELEGGERKKGGERSWRLEMGSWKGDEPKGRGI